MDALSTYRIWTPPNSYLPSSTVSSPSKSAVPRSESEHEKNSGNRGTHPTGSNRISPSTGPLWYGEKQWLVIFHAGGKQWKLPHNPFSQKSCHLHEFLNSGPFSNSAYFDQDVDVESGLPLIELLQVESAEGEAFLMALYNSEWGFFCFFFLRTGILYELSFCVTFSDYISCFILVFSNAHLFPMSRLHLFRLRLTPSLLYSNWVRDMKFNSCASVPWPIYPLLIPPRLISGTGEAPDQIFRLPLQDQMQTHCTMLHLRRL